MQSSRTSLAHFLVAACGLLLGGCGESEPEDTTGGVGAPCDAQSENKCDVELTCEASTQGEGGVCATPIVIRGELTDALNADPVGDARIVVLDETGMPAGSATSDADGHYEVSVAVPRDADGSPAQSSTWTLAVSAQDYQPFPYGPRQAIPIQAEQLSTDDGTLVVEDANTQVPLIPLNDTTPRFVVSGKTDANAAGALVVAGAEQGPAPYGLVGLDGTFTVFNVPAGETRLELYRRGLPSMPYMVDVSDTISDVKLPVASHELSTVEGSVNIVNAPGGSLTSVVLVPDIVYDAISERGPVPLGLRVPDAPDGPNVTGEFRFKDVPPGEYVVLAAFENDSLVRDPDATIGGTALQKVTVTPGQDIALDQSFKLTEHLMIDHPGGEQLDEVSGDVEFAWADDSSEDRYHFVLRSALGELVWEQPEVPGVSGSALVTLEYAGPELIPGMFYQFSVTSLRDTNDGVSAISRTEDLRGVFRYK